MKDKAANSSSEVEEEEGGELSVRQQSVLPFLLSEPTIKGAARKSGIPEFSLHRWLKQATFSEVFREAREQALLQAMASLQSATSTAVTALLVMIANRRTPPTVKLGAIRTVLEFGLRSREVLDMEARLADVESRWQGKGKV